MRSLWQRLTFSWATPLLALGARRPLQQEDLAPLPPDLQPHACGELLWRKWEEERTGAGAAGRAPSLLRALGSAYGWPYLALGALKLASDALNFVGPLLLNALLRHLSSSSSSGEAAGGGGGLGTWLDTRSPLFGYGCAGLLAASLVLKAAFNTHYSYRQGVLAARLRAAITVVVFRKALALNSATLAGVGTGRVQTLMSVDADRVVNLCLSLHELWSLPAQIVVALLLLYTQVQFAFLAGMVIVVLLIPANRWLSLRIWAASKRMMGAKDRRVRVMMEVLRGIRQIKAAAWEPFFVKQVNAERAEELSALAVRKYLDALCVYCWAATSLLFSLATFGLFVLLGKALTVPLVFTSLALFNVLIAPLNAFPWVVNGVVEAVVSLKRVADFLGVECPGPPPSLTAGAGEGAAAGGGRVGDPGAAIVVRGGSFSWGSGGCGAGSSGGAAGGSGPAGRGLGTEQARQATGAVLSGVDLEVPKGALVAVTGEVGCGKSSLLAALLGELHRTGGSVEVRGSVALVPQQPWLMQGTIRDNILFGAPYNAERYAAALHACALEPDLHALPAGDAAPVGGAGARLSGGQRTRVALARALYQLDDVLAAVDAHVAAWLLRHALLGPLLRGKTVLVLTHSPALLAAAALVVRLGPGGKVTVDQGRAKAPSAAAVVAEGAGGERRGEGGLEPVENEAGGDDGSSAQGAEVPHEFAVAAAEKGQPEEPQEADGGEEEEERASGHVRLRVYAAYAAATGWGWVAVILISLVLMQATRTGSDLWLSYWVAHTPSPSPHAAPQSSSSCRPLLLPDSAPAWRPGLSQQQQQQQPCWGGSVHWAGWRLPLAGGMGLSLDPTVRFYLGVLLGIAAANSLFTLARAFSFAKGGMLAATRTHRRLLSAVLHLPAAFFDATPVGRILNRFSSDTSTVDDSLPFIANILLANVASLSGVVAVLALTQPALLLLLVALGALYRVLQRFYRATSRELRRLDALARSPVYTAFSEVLSGGATIRAFGAQGRFLSNSEQAVAAQQRVSLASLGISNWLGFRLQLMAAALAAAVSGAAVMEHQGLLPWARSSAAAGLVGLSLAYVLPITGLLNGLLTSSAETEQEMVAMERLLQYMVLPPQQDTLPPLTALEGPAGGGEEEGAGMGLRAPLLPKAQRGAASAPPADPGPGWLQQGHLVFDRVWLRYTPDGPDVLRGLSLEAAPGTKLGIVGRTGAGKSSLVSCLLRLTEVSGGRITVDGRDVAQVPLRRLRSAIGMVPQAPFVFHGSLRENLDPFALHSDPDLAAALRQVQLWVPLCALLAGRGQGPGSSSSGSSFLSCSPQQAAAAAAAGLMGPAAPAHVSVNVQPSEGAMLAGVLGLQLGEGSLGLSQGQQQLLCLARVLLKRPRLLCLDEYAASVDPATAATMQQVVREQFGGATVVEVAHRLSSVRDCDQVAVMEAGQVVELGRPAQLERHPSSAFARMVRQQQEQAGHHHQH